MSSISDKQKKNLENFKKMLVKYDEHFDSSINWYDWNKDGTAFPYDVNKTINAQGDLGNRNLSTQSIDTQNEDEVKRAITIVKYHKRKIQEKIYDKEHEIQQLTTGNSQAREQNKLQIRELEELLDELYKIEGKIVNDLQYLVANANRSAIMVKTAIENLARYVCNGLGDSATKVQLCNDIGN